MPCVAVLWAEGWRTAWLAVAACSAASAGAQQAVFEPYQENAGLTSMATACLAQAPNGLLWICTQSGLFRFDGFHIDREPLPVGDGVAVDEAVADPWGRLWVATEAGLMLRTESAGVVKWSPVLRPDGVALKVEGKQRLDVDRRGVAFAMDKGSHLWSIAVPGDSRPLTAVRVDLPAYDAPPAAYRSYGAPVRFAGDDLWFGCGTGLCLRRGAVLRRWDEASGLPRDTWANILAASDGSIWARSTNHLARLAPGSTRFEAVDAPEAGLWPSTIPLTQDASGAIVTATDDGVARWDGHGWKYWTPREGLPETAVRSILVDAEGTMWLGTAGRGLHRWVGYGSSEHWTPAQGLTSSVVWSIARDGDGKLCASTSRGVDCMDGQTRVFHSVEPAMHARVGGNKLSVDASGALWWKSRSQVLTLPAGESLARVFVDDPTIDDVAQGHESIYLSGRQRIERLVASPAGPQRQALAPESPALGIPNGVISDGARDWFLVHGGAYTADRGRWTPMLDDGGEPLRIAECAAFAGADELWTSDSRGLSIYTVNAGVARFLRRIDAAVFGGATVVFIRADRDRGIWVGTSSGVFVLRGQRWSHLDRNNSLLWNDVSSDAIFFDRDGSTWIGTSAGITRLLPSIRSPMPPVLRLEQFQLGADAVVARPSKPIAWADRRIGITLATPSLGRGRSLRLEYRLQDDEAWHRFEGNLLKFESLEPASYRLQVRVAAQLPDDEVGPPLALAFTIEPPWWRSLPASLVYVGVLALLWMLSLHVLRRRARTTRLALELAIAQRTSELVSSRESVRMLGAHNALAQEEERQRVSRELHDEMGQQLAALRMEVSVLRKHAGAGRSPNDGAFDVLIRRVDDIVAGMRAIVTKLRPPALDGGLEAALEWLASEFTRHTGVTCDVAVDDGARELQTEVATMIFRVAQESLNNVRRHARASRVDLCLRMQGAGLELSIHDDGLGFDTREPRRGFGLFGMDERAGGFGGALIVESASGAGTTIRLLLP